MRATTRVCVAACAVMVLAVVAPAPAIQIESRAVVLDWKRSGTIALPIVHPGVPRQIFESTGRSDSPVGYVYSLPTWADGRPYELRLDSGLTGRDNLDVYFYESIESTQADPFGRLCPYTRNETDPKLERGTVCPGPSKGNWAVVLLGYPARATVPSDPKSQLPSVDMRVGANSTFTLYIPEPPK